MRVLIETDNYIVLDDFLEERDFRLILEYTQFNDYARNPKWIKPWDLADRPPWQSGETVYHPEKRLPSGSSNGSSAPVSIANISSETARR
jgi:hypothetical protein